jgi:hypothetical protein
VIDVPVYTRKQLEQVLSVPDLLLPMAEAFKNYSAALAESPVAVLHPTATSDLHLKAATTQGRKIFTVSLSHSTPRRVCRESRNTRRKKHEAGQDERENLSLLATRG